MDAQARQSGLTPALNARLAKGTSAGVEVEAWDTPTLSGAGGLRSTAHDLARLLSANMGLLPTSLDAAIALAQQPRVEAVPGKVHVGLGWHIVSLGGAELLMHDGGTGGYRSFIGLRRDAQVGVVLLANSTEDVADIGMHLLEPSLPLTVAGLQPPAPPPLVKAVARTWPWRHKPKVFDVSFVPERQDDNAGLAFFISASESSPSEVCLDDIALLGPLPPP